MRGIPQEESAEAGFALVTFDAQVDAARANYAQMIALLQTTLAALAAQPTLRVLCWRDFLDAKVADASQIVNKLGAGTSSSLADIARVAEPVTVAALYSDILFPKAIKRSTSMWEPLVVRLTTAPQGESAATTQVNVSFVDPGQPEQVDVVITAPDFEERFQSWQRTIVVYADRNSQPAVFLVRSNVLGDKRITVDFYHHGRQVGSAAFATAVQDAPVAGRATILGEGFSVESFAASATPPPDLELRIVRAASENRLHFTLHSANPKVGYHYLPCGSVELVAANPFDFLESKFERLSLLAAQETHDDASVNAAALVQIAAIGEELWDELLPEEFKGKLWQEIRRHCEAGTIRTLQITSDEPWIPWEMVKPYLRDEVTGDEVSEPFWAERFAMARWLAGRGSAAEVQVQTARLVAPELDLAYVADEKAAFDALATLGIATAPPLQTRAAVQSLFADGGVQLLHFASHANFNAANPERSPISLQDGELYPEDLSMSATKGLRMARPLVFLNACSVGRLAFGMTGLGGWAEKLVHTGRVSAFVGTLWEVNDRLVAAFAQHFYTRLFAGDALGEALRAARLHIRDLDPANPTWLAYTLYGDPSAIIRAPQPN